MTNREAAARPPGPLWVSRTCGAVSGILLVLLGARGALIPFIGPYVGLSFTPDGAWTWTAGRGWLEVLAGAAAALGRLLREGSGNRATVNPGPPVSVHDTAIPLNPAKTVRLITLPTNPDLHAFAIG